MALLAAWAGSRVLELPGFLYRGLAKAAVIVVVLQVGIWTTRLLTGWLDLVSKKKSEETE